MAYTPVTEEGRRKQLEVNELVNRLIQEGGREMDSAVSNTVTSFQTEFAAITAEAADELDGLKKQLEAIKNAGATDTHKLVALAEDSIIALNKREAMLTKIGVTGVKSIKKAVGL